MINYKLLTTGKLPIKQNKIINHFINKKIKAKEKQKVPKEKKKETHQNKDYP